MQQFLLPNSPNAFVNWFTLFSFFEDEPSELNSLKQGAKEYLEAYLSDPCLQVLIDNKYYLVSFTSITTGNDPCNILEFRPSHFENDFLKNKKILIICMEALKEAYLDSSINIRIYINPLVCSIQVFQHFEI